MGAAVLLENVPFGTGTLAENVYTGELGAVILNRKNNPTPHGKLTIPV